MIFWIILIIMDLIIIAMLVRFGKGNNFVRVEHKHLYMPADNQNKQNKQNNNHRGNNHG